MNEYTQYKMRMPTDLYRRLSEEAAAAERSLSAEIIWRLEASFRRSVDDADYLELADEIRAKFDLQQEALQIAKVGAVVGNRTLAKIIQAAFPEEDRPSHVERLRLAAENVVAQYPDVDEASFDRIAERAAQDRIAREAASSLPLDLNVIGAQRTTGNHRMDVERAKKPAAKKRAK